jgi:hypothetical protein
MKRKHPSTQFCTCSLKHTWIRSKTASSFLKWKGRGEGFRIDGPNEEKTKEWPCQISELKRDIPPKGHTGYRPMLTDARHRGEETSSIRKEKSQ